MKENTAYRDIVRRAGIVGLALFLIACSAGLGYVVHVTHETARRTHASEPSVLPLIVMAILAAFAGIAALRFAFDRSDHELV